MLNQMLNFFISAFSFPGLSWTLILMAIALSFVFGIIWLTPFWPPLVKKPQLWIVAVISAILTWIAIAFTQIPLQSWTGQALFHIWSQSTLTKWILLAAIPQILLSGLVQEASKLAPVFLYWRRNKKKFTPRYGLIAGAVAGAGFGIFEAVWVHNTIFASGWNWHLVGIEGFLALLGFWERFFAVAFHISASALAGYGLAKRKGWQFYLIASFLHGLMNYSIVLLQSNLLTAIQEEIYGAVLTVIIISVVLWLRWCKTKEIPANNSADVTPDTTPKITLN